MGPRHGDPAPASFCAIGETRVSVDRHRYSVDWPASNDTGHAGSEDRGQELLKRPGTTGHDRARPGTTGHGKRIPTRGDQRLWPFEVAMQHQKAKDVDQSKVDAPVDNHASSGGGPGGVVAGRLWRDGCANRRAVAATAGRLRQPPVPGPKVGPPSCDGRFVTRPRTASIVRRASDLFRPDPRADRARRLTPRSDTKVSDTKVRHQVRTPRTHTARPDRGPPHHLWR